MKRRIEIRVSDKEEGQTVEKLLLGRLGLTRNQVSQAKFREDGICVNGVRQRVNCRVHENDMLQVLLEEENTSSGHLVPACGPLDILYEDEDLLAADKPAGLVVHPSPGHYGDSLANMLVRYFEEKDVHVRIRPVGRLDKETSGIVVFAKNQAAASRLEKQKAEGEYIKEYLALVDGHLTKKSGEIRLPLRKIPGELMKMEVSADGKDAWTEYETLEEYEIMKEYKIMKEYNVMQGHHIMNEHGGSCAALVRLKIYTGRTHQIRVHMAYTGHPLLGDTLYGTGDGGLIGRAALHAARLTFRQPFTGEKICIEAPFPEDMKRCIRMFLN